MSDHPEPASPDSTKAAARTPLADRISEPLQRFIGVLIGSNHRPPRWFKSLLNGTWLGHPLHPVITDIPIGAWTLAALFDIIWLVSPTSNAWAARGAEVLVIAGVVVSLGAIVTGSADWSDTYGRERTIGLLHGALMILVAIVYAVSFGLRYTVGSGESVVGAVLGFVGVAVWGVAAFLGGEMVFTLGTNVNHTAWEAAGEDFEPVIALNDLPENRLTRVVAAGVPVVLVRLGDKIAAISATCPHAGGPLDEGSLEDGVVTCPWHSSRFRMRDGRVLTGPATTNAPRYNVRIRDGQVEVLRAQGH
jgi:nitrite reductase/ring-hydroxylating ferredoxin subunit/uncharacterized membrane protein